MVTCSFLCRVVRRKEIQSCYFLACVDWMWCGMTISLGLGKPISWKVWKAFPEVVDTFIKLSQIVEITTKDFKMIDHFIVLMYDRTFRHQTVDKRRKYLPTQMNCTLYNCQPTRDALCNTFAGECHSHTCGRIAWHWTKIIKICHVQVGLWMTKATSSQYEQNYQKHHKNANNWNTAPVKDFVLATVVHAKNTTFRVQICAAANETLKIRLIYSLYLMTSVIL